MKPNRLELVLLGLTAVFILFTTGFFLFHRTTGGVFAIETETVSSRQTGRPAASSQTARASSPSPNAASPAGSAAPSPAQTAAAEVSAGAASASAGSPPPSSAFSEVNINTATESQLDSLPGIGPTRASAIVEYRTKHGPFQSIRDIMKVSGIKDGVFSKIKDYITVK
ncbi:MAG: helix-hairpin-helix domain-containing protein [Oscillospiraceae bacterium]|nr:helix-hairpin-helix domain-containing protein [Oscillospiraceae bacterium]